MFTINLFELTGVRLAVKYVYNWNIVSNGQPNILL
jgi:hypothetical protein